MQIGLNILPQVGKYIENFKLIKSIASTIDCSRKMPNFPSMTIRCIVGIEHLANLPPNNIRHSEDVRVVEKVASKKLHI